MLYFGIGYLALALITLYKWRINDPFQKAGILLGIAIFIITTPLAKPIYAKLPLHNLLWPDRFVTVGVAALLFGSIKTFNFWELFRSKRFITLGLTTLLLMTILADSLISSTLIRTRTYPRDIDNILRAASGTKNFKLAVLDTSRLGSIPTYLAGQKYGISQIFGWAWQGAYTASNTMLINTALQKGWNDYLFDRLIEMGATHLVVKSDILKEPGIFRDKAKEFGFLVQVSQNGMTLFTRENGPYLVTADYEILGIGRFTPTIATVFPEIRLGSYYEVDKYSLKELTKYKTIFLSGFSWKSKKTAEDLLLAYVKKGGRVVIDLSGSPSDVLSNRSSFLGVVAEPVVMEVPPLINVGSTVTRLTQLPRENLPWKTFVLEGVDKVSSLVSYYDRKRPIEGYKVYRNQNIYFIGLNLPYYAYLTKDPVILNMLGNLLKSDAKKTIPRKTVALTELTFAGDSGKVKFTLPEEFRNHNILIPLAYLDTMKLTVTGPEHKLGTIHNFISINGREGDYQVEFRNEWPSSTPKGLFLSMIGLFLLLMVVGARPMLKKFKSVGLTAVLLLVLLGIVPQNAFASPEIVMDGQFEDWEQAAYLADPEGDVMDVSDRTAIAGDTRRIYWGTNRNDNDPNLYFSIVRYQPMDDNHKMTGKIMFDINNNGDYTDPDDRIGFFRYIPNSGKVAVKIFRVDDQNNSPAWHEIGKWGAKRNGPDDGLQFEFYFPFSSLGIIANQPIRFYATTSFIANDNPKRDEDWVRSADFNDFDLFKHDFDLIPDPDINGIRDIQYSPVPVLGYPLLTVFVLIALVIGIQKIRKRKMSSNGI